MSQMAFKIAINIPVIIIVFCLGLFLPEFSNDDVLFGIRIPPEQRHSKMLKDLILGYKKLYILICGGYTIAFIIVFFFIGKYYVLIPGLVLFIFVMQVVYYMIYKKIKQLDIVVNWNRTDNNYVILDNRKKSLKVVLQGWFVIPALISILSLALGAAIYPNVPMLLPSGIFSFSAPSAWIKKSIKLIFLCPVFEIVITAISYYIFVLLSRLKPYGGQINTEIAEHHNNVFFKIWSAAIISVCSLVNIILLFLQLRLFVLISARVFILLCTLIMAVIASILILSFKSIERATGSIDVSVINAPVKERTASAFIDRNDSKYWLLGNFYFNPHDPCLYIKSNTLKGVNFNFGKPLAWLMLSIPLMGFLLAFIYLYIHKI